MNPSNGQGSLDYLNQIAPQAPKRPLFELNLRTVLIGAGILLVLVLILAGIAGSISDSRKEPWQRLSLRVSSTAVIAEDASTKLKSSQLRSLNSDLRLYLTNTQRDMAAHLAANDVVIEDIPASVVASESSEPTLATLEDGRLNAKYDTTYAREMGYILATLVALLDQLEASATGDTQLYLESAHDNLVPIAEGIQEFSTANE